MTYLYTLRGPDNTWLGEATEEVVDRLTGLSNAYEDYNLLIIDGYVTYEGGTSPYKAEYYADDNGRLTLMRTSFKNSYATVTGDLPTADELLRNQPYPTFSENIQWYYRGQDVIDGSREGGSLRGWTHGGDDAVYLHSGISNYINAGDGNDYIQNFNHYSDGVYEGGFGNDRIAVNNGQAWGGSGYDSFHLIPVWDENAIYSFAEVMDYEIGVDTIYAEAPVYYAISDEGVWLSAGNGETSMLVRNVYDINQITIVENLA